jgi:hypothetical protein
MQYASLTITALDFLTVGQMEVEWDTTLSRKKEALSIVSVSP